jgi:hypothetical protein
MCTIHISFQSYEAVSLTTTPEIKIAQDFHLRLLSACLKALLYSLGPVHDT